MPNVFSNPFTDVKLEKVSAGGQEISNVAVMVKGDDDVYHSAGIRAAGYNLITNQFAKDTVDNIKTRSGYTWKSLRAPFFDGRKYVEYFITNETITSIQNGKEMPLHLGILCRNAYDGKGAFGIEFYGCNMECTNQYYSRNLFGYFVIYHTESDSYHIDDAVEQISVGANKLIEVAPRIQDMRSQPLTSEMIINTKKALEGGKSELPNSKWGDVLTRLAVEEATKFGLYQALTWVVSHEMKGLNTISIGSRITEGMLE